MEEIFKSYKDNLPLIILFIYSFGSIYLFSYYSHFNIAIEQYISLSDILFFALRILIILSLAYVSLEMIILLIGLIITNILSEGDYKAALANRPGRQYSYKTEKRFTRLYAGKYLGNKFQTIASGACGIMLITGTILISNGYNFGLSLGDFVSISIPYLIFREYIEKNWLGKDVVNINKTRREYSILGVIAIAIILHLNAVYEAKLVKSNSQFEKVNLKARSDDGLIFTNENVVFVGSTSNYIFLFDIVANETIIHARSDIHDLRFGGE